MIKKIVISNLQLVIRSLATIVVLITIYYLPITSVSFAQEKCDPKNTEQYCLSVPLLDKQGKPIYEIPKGAAGIAKYIRTIYQFSLGIGALLAVAMIVFGGIEYTVSAGNVSKQQEARDRILNAVYGLALLMAAVLILFTINPNLVNIGLPTLKPVQPPSYDDDLARQREIREKAEAFDKVKKESLLIINEALEKPDTLDEKIKIAKEQVKISQANLEARNAEFENARLDYNNVYNHVWKDGKLGDDDKVYLEGATKLQDLKEAELVEALQLRDEDVIRLQELQRQKQQP